MATFDTKFGDLNLSSWTGSSSATNKTSGLTSKPYSFIFTSGKKTYRFIPEDVIQRGFTDPDTKRQFYLTNALNKDTLKSLYEKGEAVDLVGGLTESKANQLEKFGYSTKGVLVPDSDYQSLGLNKVRSYEPGIIDRGAGVGFITGLGQDKQGNLMYSGEQLGSSQYAYIDQEGRKAGYEKSKSKWGGFLGDMFYDIGKAIAGVPFLPEILGVATGNPYVYAATKGLAAGASGEDPLKAGLKIGATIGVTQALSGPGGQPTAQPSGVDYSLTAGGADVGGTGLQATGAEGFQAGAMPPATSLLDTGLGTIDYSLLAGTSGQLPGTGFQTIGAEGLQLPSTPEVAGMGGGQGITVPVAGGTVTGAGLIPVGATPSLGDPGSFINDPNVLGQPVFPAQASSISITDALRGANLANQLMGGQQTATGFPQQQAPFQPTGVDYSGIYGLLGQRPSVPGISSLLGPAQLMYPSLLR
jgi:hypothetical protein